MKNILIPTDFSAFAAYAVDAGIFLAKSFNANVFLYHCLDLPAHWKEMTDLEKAEFPDANQAIENAKTLMEASKAKAEQQAVPLKFAYSGGNLIHQVDEFVELYNIDLIVMGSHGTSGAREYFIGSNAQKMVRTIHCPQLIVKRPLDKKLDQVVYASDFTTKGQASFKRFLSFIKPFRPVIHLVGINTAGYFSQPFVITNAAMNDYKAMCGELEVHKHFFRDYSVEAGVRHLSKTIKADLISVSNHQRKPFKRMLVGSTVESLVNLSEIPVLSIDFNVDD